MKYLFSILILLIASLVFALPEEPARPNNTVHPDRGFVAAPPPVSGLGAVPAPAVGGEVHAIHNRPEDKQLSAADRNKVWVLVAGFICVVVYGMV